MHTCAWPPFVGFDHSQLCMQQKRDERNMICAYDLYCWRALANELTVLLLLLLPIMLNDLLITPTTTSSTSISKVQVVERVVACDVCGWMHPFECHWMKWGFCVRLNYTRKVQ